MKTTSRIYLSRNGALIGTVENFDLDRYETDCDNTEGHVRSGAVLDDADLTALGLSGRETIYAIAILQ